MSPDASYARMLFALPTESEPTAEMVDIGVRIRSRDNGVQNQAVKERKALLDRLFAERTAA